MRPAHGKARLAWGQPENRRSKDDGNENQHEEGPATRNRAPGADRLAHHRARGKEVLDPHRRLLGTRGRRGLLPAPRSFPHRRRARRSPHAEGRRSGRRSGLRPPREPGHPGSRPALPLQGAGARIVSSAAITSFCWPSQKLIARDASAKSIISSASVFSMVRFMSFPSSVGLRLRALGTAAGPSAPVRAATSEEELHACPLGRTLEMTGKNAKPRDGRNDGETGTLSEAGRMSANAERIAGI